MFRDDGIPLSKLIKVSIKLNSFPEECKTEKLKLFHKKVPKLILKIIDRYLTYLNISYICGRLGSNYIVGNQANEWISKRLLQENKARQISEKTNISLFWNHTYVRVYQGVKTVTFCFLVTIALNFVLLPYYRQIYSTKKLFNLYLINHILLGVVTENDTGLNLIDLKNGIQLQRACRFLNKNVHV